MSRIIYKYPLELEKTQEVHVHRIYQLLCVQAQNKRPWLWAVVNPDTVARVIVVKMFGTGGGHPDPDDKYIGTVQLDGFVWHYFQGEKP